MKILIAGEPTSTMQVGLDTGVVLAAEMMSRGFWVDYVNLESVDWRLSQQEYFRKLPIQRIHQVKPLQKEPFELEGHREEEVTSYDVIWQRLDPPVDERYIGHMKQFAQLPKSILQINNPNWNWKLSEHLLPQNYPEFSIPTYECCSLEEMKKKIRDSKGDMVAKPLHLYSGQGIEFFNSSTSDFQLRDYWEKWKPKIALQPYIPEVTTQGDLRIVVMNCKVMGSVLRRPKPGSRLANLHQGGSAHFFSPTERQLKACDVISRDLISKGLYLLGLDFIGDYLTEVNITCPSAIPQINQVMGIRAEKGMVDEMVTLAHLGPKLGID